MKKNRLLCLRIALSFLLVMGTLLLAACATEQSSTAESFKSEQSQAEKGAKSPAEKPTNPSPEPSAEEPAKPQAAADSALGIGIGDTAPDFELPLLSGGTVKLSSLRGKPVLINFMTTWCGPCQREFPAVQQIYEEYGDRVQVLAISVGEPREDVDNSFSAGPYTFPIAFDTDDVLYQDYRIDFIPQSFFISSDGVVIDYLAGGSSYQAFKTSTEKLLD